MDNKEDTLTLGLVAAAAGVIIVVGFLISYPVYNVWASEKAGQAELAQASFNRKIAIEEAQAELDSAELKRQSDVIRANGIAESNEIIAQSLTTEYIQWRWVEGLHDGSSETIYIPTETQLPLLEATRRG